ncbi:MAG: 30S ribosomal protein S6 [Thermodesulfobacteriota bacterium]
MRRYETIFIAKANMPDDELTAIIDRNRTIIESDGGSVLNLDKWGVRKLAYSIKKEHQGNYTYTEYVGTPAAVAEIERLLRIDDKVLKYLTVKLADSYSETEAAEPDKPAAAEA